MHEIESGAEAAGEEVDSAPEVVPEAKRPKKIYKQKFNRAWETDPLLKGWISAVKTDPYKAYCKTCGKELVAGLSELKKHASTKKHQESMQSVSQSRPITQMLSRGSHSDQVKKAEIKVAAFIVEHNLPFRVMDHLSGLVATCFPDSKIAHDFSSKRTKTRSIVKNVMAQQFRDQLEEVLKHTKFSVIIDETTDIAARKQLAIVVRFYCNRERRVKSSFFKTIEVTAADADHITAAVLGSLEKASIPTSNIIGFAADTTNVMFGCNHSVSTLLKEKIPYLFTMKCLCHSANLCASYACEKLPRIVEDMVRDTYSYFSHSAKRLAEFAEFQHFTETEPHKILKPAQTRWLSLQMCVKRILEQWDALKLFFVHQAATERLVAAENLASAYNNPIFKLYFHFLDSTLPKFTKFNKLFQSEFPNLHNLSSELVSLYKSLLSCYMTNMYIRSMSIDKLDPASKQHMLPLTSISLGHTVSSILTKPAILAMKVEVKGFLEHCQNFLIEAATQVKVRFPITDPILSSLGFLDPLALSTTQCSEVIDVASKFPNILEPTDLVALEEEWRQLSFTEPPFIFNSRKDRIDQFWGEIDEIKFPTVNLFVKSLLALPHSNADIERVFSKVALIKTKHRNRLKTSTLDALLMVQCGLPNDCVHFDPDSNMCKCVNAKMYDSQSSSSDD